MKKKIIISALALTIGAGLAGSITSTAAWYQYSTKVNGAYVGASGGAIGNLNMRIRQDGQNANAGWTTFISKEAIKAYLESQDMGDNVRPVTPGALAKDGNLALDTDGNPVMYANPIAGNGPYSQWKKANKGNYVVIPLQLRYVEQGNSGAENVAKPVYLSELVLEQRTVGGATNDITEALRFHISSYNSGSPASKTGRLVSKKGGTTVTNGKLDLDGDGNFDSARASDKYGFSATSAPSGDPIVYGEGEQVSFTAENSQNSYTGRKYYNAENTLTDDSTVYSLVAQSRDGKDGDDLKDDSLDYAEDVTKAIGTTVAGNTNFLNVDLTIWVEGWQKFENPNGYSSIWSSKFIGSDFNIGFEFATNAEADPQQQIVNP